MTFILTKQLFSVFLVEFLCDLKTLFVNYTVLNFKYPPTWCANFATLRYVGYVWVVDRWWRHCKFECKWRRFSCWNEFFVSCGLLSQHII